MVRVPASKDRPSQVRVRHILHILYMFTNVFEKYTANPFPGLQTVYSGSKVCTPDNQGHHVVYMQDHVLSIQVYPTACVDLWKESDREGGRAVRGIDSVVEEEEEEVSER